MFDQGWLFAVIDILGGAILAGALVFGMIHWRKKSIDPATEAASRAATERMYHHEEAEAEAARTGRPTVRSTQ